jgi:uncharacterized Fe-S cluster-containing radical SAM superfamily protein
MLHIHNTVSLCNICYRHIPAHIIEEDNLIKIVKRCGEHGEFKSVVETDKKFYYSLKHTKDLEVFNQVLFEVTDKCQLKCPHCYHLPDNKKIDKPIDQIIEQLTLFPKSCVPMMAGAEPTLRTDFIELVKRVCNTDFSDFQLLSNGVKFANKDFTQKVYNAGLRKVCIGLNHWSYQGKTVHSKQLKAIDNLISAGFHLPYVGYTLESLDHLSDVLNEIDLLKDKDIWQFRIRCGSFIGRSGDQKRSYLSNLVNEIKKHTVEDCELLGLDDNTYHVMMKRKGALLRLIQWPDVTNIDMEELATGPWCQFYDGPITNFVHQVITRDAYTNNKLPQLDICPSKYQYQDPGVVGNNYWRNTFTNPITVNDVNFSLPADVIIKNKPKVIFFN